MSAVIAWSMLRVCLKKPSYYIVVKRTDEDGNVVIEYMNRDGALFWGMDIDGRRAEHGGQYFDTYEEAKAILEKHQV